MADEIENPDEEPMRAILLGQALAINAYSHLEQLLASFLGLVAGTDPESAAIIYFRIINTRARNAILQELYAQRFKDQYASYVRSLFKFIGALDQSRNEIVHWHVLTHHSDNVDGSQTSETKLIRPNLWQYSTESKAYTVDDLNEFTHKCNFVSKSLVMFAMFISGKMNAHEETSRTWREIFLQPLMYPPPSTHPLYQKT